MESLYLSSLVLIMWESLSLNLFGDDYPTVDGTGVRDYIHVVDLAKAHVKVIEYLQNPKVNPLIANLGYGKGYSVLEMVQAFSQACGREIL